MKKLILVITIIAVACCALFSFVACLGKVDMSYDDTTKYGIYWIGDDNSDYVRSGENMDTKYFDPSKPTLVFAHGWEPYAINSTDGLFEDFVTHQETISYTGTAKRDYAAILKEQGYNVALLSWFSYAKRLGTAFGYIWVTFDGGYALSTRFAMELALTLGEDYDGEVKMVGHSYGSQMALATTYQLINLYERKSFTNDSIIPTRLTLADPYFGERAAITGWSTIADSKISLIGEKINAREPATLFADVVDKVVSKKDIAIDMYFGMSVASTSYYKYDGSDAAFEKLLKNSTIVKSEGLKDRYGDTNIHNIVRDWVLLSIVDNVLLYDQNSDIAPSGAASDAQIKAMRGKCYYQNYRGLNLSQEYLTLIDRSVTTF